MGWNVKGADVARGNAVPVSSGGQETQLLRPECF